MHIYFTTIKNVVREKGREEGGKKGRKEGKKGGREGGGEKERKQGVILVLAAGNNRLN